MKTPIAFLAAALTATLAISAPAGAAPGSLPSQTTSVALHAQLKANLWRPAGGEYNGTLRLQIAPSGIIFGSYVPDSGPGYDPVNGGLDGNGSIWLEIGSSGQVQITGTYANGKIVGVASGPGVSRLTFLAAPLRS